MRKVQNAFRLENLDLSGADCFVLDMLGDNIPDPVMDKLLAEMAKRTVLKNDMNHVDNHNQNLLKYPQPSPSPFHLRHLPPQVVLHQQSI